MGSINLSPTSSASRSLFSATPSPFSAGPPAVVAPSRRSSALSLPGSPASSARGYSPSRFPSPSPPPLLSPQFPGPSFCTRPFPPTTAPSSPRATSASVSPAMPAFALPPPVAPASDLSRALLAHPSFAHLCAPASAAAANGAQLPTATAGITACSAAAPGAGSISASAAAVSGVPTHTMFNAHNPTASSTSAAFTASADPPFAGLGSVRGEAVFSASDSNGRYDSSVDMAAQEDSEFFKISRSCNADSSSMDASSPDTPLQQLPSFSSQPLALSSLSSQPLALSSLSSQPLTLSSLSSQPLTIPSLSSQPLPLSSLSSQPLTLPSLSSQPLTQSSLSSQPLTLSSLSSQPLSLPSFSSQSLNLPSTFPQPLDLPSISKPPSHPNSLPRLPSLGLEFPRLPSLPSEFPKLPSLDWNEIEECLGAPGVQQESHAQPHTGATLEI
ncbi:hypothetical protein CLOP_g13767 [Closterium sp. NIES-67]|nr:hypothetical protein CLOP_g13767 [Closterium sp. NIES-67]